MKTLKEIEQRAKDEIHDIDNRFRRLIESEVKKYEDWIYKMRKEQPEKNWKESFFYRSVKEHTETAAHETALILEKVHSERNKRVSNITEYTGEKETAKEYDEDEECEKNG